MVEQIPTVYKAKELYATFSFSDTVISFNWEGTPHLVAVVWNEESKRKYRAMSPSEPSGYVDDDVYQYITESMGDVFGEENSLIHIETSPDANHAKRALEICEKIIGGESVVLDEYVPRMMFTFDHYLAVCINPQKNVRENSISLVFADLPVCWGLDIDPSTQIGEKIFCHKNKGASRIDVDGNPTNTPIKTIELINTNNNAIATLIRNIPYFLTEHKESLGKKQFTRRTRNDRVPGNEQI